MLTSAHAQVAVCLNLTRKISRTRTVAEIYAIALDALEEGLGVSRSSILLFDPDHVMRFKAWRGLSDGYRSAVEGHTPWSPDEVDAQPIVVPDVTREPSLAPFLPTIAAEGIAAMVFVPLISSGRVIGKFMLYADVPWTPAADDLELASVVASQVAFAVERTRAEEQARESEERLRFALDAANMGTWNWDVRTNMLRWSENLERVHGVLPGTFDGTFASYEREIHPEDRERVLGSIQRALTTGAPHDVEYRIVAPDGSIRWVEGKGRVERGPDGNPVRMTGVCMNVTPRKDAELARLDAIEEAHRAAERLAAIVESSGDAIVGKRLDGVITSWNPAAERLFGYAPTEAIGRHVSLIVPGDRQAEQAVVLSRVAAGEQVAIETVRLGKDGRRLDVSLMLSPIRDPEGRIVGAAKTARDISDRKRAEAERDQLHQRLTTLVGASAALLTSPDTRAVVAATIATARNLLVADAYAVWVRDSTGPAWRMASSDGVSAAFSNRVISSYRGGASSAVMPFTTALPVPDVFAQPLLEEHRAAYQEEGIRSMLVCPMQLGADRGGTLVFYYRTPHAFSTSDMEAGQTLANLAAAAWTTADLHDQLRSERNAAEAARSRAAFLADATAILSRSLDYEQTLAAVARLAVPDMADWCAVDIVAGKGQLQRVAVAHVDPRKVEYARALHERYPPARGVPGGVYEVIRTGQPAMLESIPPELVAAQARDDEHRRILEELALTSYMCVPLVASGATLGAITFVHAESSRHYDAADLAFARDLAARAALALDNAFAYARVREASRVKDEFLATLSHELRTPLNAILGYAQMLCAGILNGERHANALTVVMRNAHSLKQIIDDVLDVSRITAGKLRLAVRPVDLTDIVQNAVATVQPAADAKSVALTFDPGGRLPPVLGDPDRLQQVIWNLLSNAVKFTPRGGRVSLRLQQAAGSVEVVVSDNGQGIEASFLPHIFERFRQADSRFAREHAGLGLGLAIVRDLIELHGGTVSARSDGPGTGATFTVRLPALAAAPLVPSPLEAEGRPVSAPLRAPAVYESLRGTRVLAVDNEEDALGLLRAILENAGADVVTAGTAQAALDALQCRPFDALIADLGMPGMDGLELIRHIRQSLAPPANGIPAAALTAYARSEDCVTALASGFQMHIAKPVNPADLVTAVSALVGRQR